VEGGREKIEDRREKVNGISQKLKGKTKTPNLKLITHNL
jgi:hypothetical protein